MHRIVLIILLVLSVSPAYYSGDFQDYLALSLNTPECSDDVNNTSTTWSYTDILSISDDVSSTDI